MRLTLTPTPSLHFTNSFSQTPEAGRLLLGERVCTSAPVFSQPTPAPLNAAAVQTYEQGRSHTRAGPELKPPAHGAPKALV